MAGGWRTTARMMATAAAAAAVSRAAESMRRLVDEAGRPELDGPVSTPGPPRFLEPPTRLTTAGPQVMPRTEDHIIAAQVHPPHEFGPAPVVVPSRGIGFRPEPRTPPPVAEMPIISRPSNREPDRPAPVQTYVPPPPPVHTAASIVEDLDEDPEIDDEDLALEVDDDDLADEAALASDPAPATAEDPVGSAAPPRDEVADTVVEDEPRLTAPPVEDTPVDPEDPAPVADEVELDDSEPDDAGPDAEPVDESTEAEPTEAELAEAAALAEARRARKKAKARAKKEKRRAKELRAQQREAQAAEDLAVAERVIAESEATALAAVPAPEPVVDVTAATPLVVEEPHVEIIVAEQLLAHDPVTQALVDDDPAGDVADEPVPDPKVEHLEHSTVVEAAPADLPEPAPALVPPVVTTSGTGRHRRDHSAISGTVRSSRGRGLRGILVEAFDTAETLVASATSGAGGAFIVEDLPAGVYRLRASDVDGDFAIQWLGGSSFDMASPLRVRDRKTRRKTDLDLLSAAGIEVSLDVRSKKAHLGVRVTERGTGITATGAVRVSTKHFSTELPLVDGQSSITLLGSTGPGKGARKVGKKVQVRYRGDRHTAPGSHTATLR